MADVGRQQQQQQQQQHRPQAPARSQVKSSRRSSAHLDHMHKHRSFDDADTATTTKSSPSSSSSSSSSRLNRPLRLRIALAGAEGSGKSCIIKRYCEKRFVARHQPTVGIDYGATRIYVDGREVSVHVFDTSGDPLFKDVRNEFYRDAHGIVLVFDVASRASFDALCDWTKEIYSELARAGRDFSSTVLTVCANKCDRSPRQVDEVEARLWAELRSFQLFETSALTGEGINDMFHAFFSQIVRTHDDGSNGLPSTPSSARRVQMNAGGGTGTSTTVKHSKSSGHVPKKREQQQQQKQQQFPPPNAAKVAQPSAEQKAVMSRLQSGGGGGGGGRGAGDPWQQLGLRRGCSQEEVNKVFRRLAMLLHPDKTAVAGADEAFKALGAARRTILRSMGVVS